MNLTNDQYYGLSILQKWYEKYYHQYIEISGTIGTGGFELIQEFFEQEQIQKKEVMYVSFDQKQVLEMAANQYHCYHILNIIYNYIREINFDSLPVLNIHSNGNIEQHWYKKLRKKIDPKYRFIVVLDSSLMNIELLKDIGSFGLPVILLKDPMLLPAPDTYTFMREANIELHEMMDKYKSNPISYFANQILMKEPLKYGNYDVANIIPRKRMNMYNIKSSDITLCLNDDTMNNINKIYRENVVHSNGHTYTNEKVIIMNNLYHRKLVNPDEKRIKVYLNKGITGTISRINKHAPNSKYVGFEFKPDFYYQAFDDLILDRYYLEGIEYPSRAMEPDEYVLAKFAYILTVPLARINHWQKVTLIQEEIEYKDELLFTMMMYTGITRAHEKINIII